MTADLLPALISIGLDVLLLFAVGLFVYFGQSLHWTKQSAPFVPVRRSAIDTIIETLRLTPDSILYDLGSGDGRVLLSAYAVEPSARYIGFELHLFPHILAKWSAISRGVSMKNVKLIHGDFTTAPITSATHVFLYLTTSVLDTLYPKLLQELHPGTRVVTCDFQFSQKQPREVVILPKNRLNSKLYVYEF